MKDTTRRQSFKAFLASTGDSMVKTIATEYATENDTVTLEKIAEKYNLTGYAMRQLIDYAISHCIVSFQIAVFIREKAHRNQSRHSNVESHFTKSDLYYDEIFKNRSVFIKHKISDSVIRNVVDLYIHSTNMSAYTIAHSVGFNVYELNLIIEKAIIFSIIDDSTVEELFYTTLSKMSSESRKARTRRKLEHLRAMRKDYECIVSEINLICKQIDEYYDIVASEDENITSLESLEKRLNDLEASRESLMYCF